MKNNTVRKIRQAIFLPAILGLMALLALTASAQTNPYVATDLGKVTQLGRLNNVAGNGISLTLQRDVLTAGGGHRDRAIIVAPFNTDARFTAELPTSTGNSSMAFAVNDSRVVVGDDGGNPIRWENNPTAGLNSAFALPHSPDCFAAGEKPVAFHNNTIVGSCSTLTAIAGAQTPVPIRWTPNAANNGFQVARLRTAPLAGFNIAAPGEAKDMNSQGTAVGYQWNSGFKNQAVIFADNQNPQILTMPGGTPSEARSISDGGFITGIGQFSTAYGTQTRGFIRTPTGTMVKALIPLALIPQFIGNPPYIQVTYTSFFVGGETNKINSSGMTVGVLISMNGQRQAIIWNAAGAYTSLSFQAGLPAGALTEAVDINDNGDILAYGVVNGETHGFLVRPTGIAFTFAAGGY